MGNADCGCCRRRRYSSSDNIDRSTLPAEKTLPEKTLPEKDRFRKRKNGATIVLSPSSGKDSPQSINKRQSLQSTNKKTNSLQSTRKNKKTNSPQSTSQKKRTQPTQKKTNVPQQNRKQITQPKKKNTLSSFNFPYGYGDAQKLPMGGKYKKEWKKWIRWITNDVAKSFRSKSWINGMAFAAMMSKVSDEIDMNKIENMEPVDRIAKALDVAERVLGAEPGYFEPKELVACRKVSNIIEQTLQLYLHEEIQIKIDRYLQSRG